LKNKTGTILNRMKWRGKKKSRKEQYRKMKTGALKPSPFRYFVGSSSVALRSFSGFDAFITIFGFPINVLDHDFLPICRAIHFLKVKGDYGSLHKCRAILAHMSRKVKGNRKQGQCPYLPAR